MHGRQPVPSRRHGKPKPRRKRLNKTKQAVLSKKMDGWTQGGVQRVFLCGTSLLCHIRIHLYVGEPPVSLKKRGEWISMRFSVASPFSLTVPKPPSHFSPPEQGHPFLMDTCEGKTPCLFLQGILCREPRYAIKTISDMAYKAFVFCPDWTEGVYSVKDLCISLYF